MGAEAWARAVWGPKVFPVRAGPWPLQRSVPEQPGGFGLCASSREKVSTNDRSANARQPCNEKLAALNVREGARLQLAGSGWRSDVAELLLQLLGWGPRRRRGPEQGHWRHEAATRLSMKPTHMGEKWQDSLGGQKALSRETWL